MINENAISLKSRMPQSKIHTQLWKNIKVKEFDNDYVSNLIYTAERKVNFVTNKIKSFGNSSQFDAKIPSTISNFNTFKFAKGKRQTVKFIKGLLGNITSNQQLSSSIKSFDKLNRNGARLNKEIKPKEKEQPRLKLRFSTIDASKMKSSFLFKVDKDSNKSIGQVELNSSHAQRCSVAKRQSGSTNTLKNLANENEGLNTIEGTTATSKKRLFSRLSFMYLNNENVSKMRRRNLRDLINEEENASSNDSENAQYVTQNALNSVRSIHKNRTYANYTSKESNSSDKGLIFNTMAANQTQEQTVKSHTSGTNIQHSNQSQQLSNSKLPISLYKGDLLNQIKDTSKNSRLDLSKSETGLANRSNANLQSTKGFSSFQKHKITTNIISNARKSIENNSKRYDKIVSSISKFDWNLEKRKEAKRKGSFKKANIKEMIDERRVLSFSIIKGDIHNKKQIISTNPDNILLLSNAYTKCKLYNSTLGRLKDGYHFKKSELDTFKQDLKLMIVGAEKKYNSIDRVSVELQATMNKLNLRQNYLDNIIERKRADIEGLSDNYFE